MLKIRGYNVVRSIALMTIAVVCAFVSSARTNSNHPDFNNIKSETLNPQSQYYYPKLLDSFLSNDTTMTDDDYYYLYYGTVFQEDYNPYRIDPNEADLRATTPLYNRAGALSRSEKEQIRRLAERSLADNPFNLRQLSYLVSVYSQAGKENLAKIWRHKFNKIIYTIANSGTGADAEHAFVVIYPANEIDFFLLSNVTVESQEFQPPYFEVFTVRAPGATESRQYWFDLHHLLEQYYAKHPEDEAAE